MHDIEKLDSQQIFIKKEVRKRLKTQKNIHRLKVRVQRNKLQLMLLKQRENAYMQLETKQDVIVPQIMNTRKGLTTRKKKRRIIELNTGKNMFSCSTISSGGLSYSLQQSLKPSIVINPRLYKKTKDFYEYTLVPDLNFTDMFVFSHKSISRNPTGTTVCKKRKEVPKKHMTITPAHHVSGPWVVGSSKLKINRKVK